MSEFHTPVLLDESIRYLNIIPGGLYLDCTLGEAGHSIKILEKIGPKGKLYSMDHDKEAIEWVMIKYKDLLNSKRWELINDNFANVGKHFQPGSLSGVLMDIGVSSRHLDIQGRGFSFRHEEDPLDMRMDQRLGVTASDLINGLTVNELAELISRYGEERGAYKIAKSIKGSDKPVSSVTELNYQISRALPAASSDKSHYQRIYQALRIAVNDELNNLKTGLSGIDTSLKSGGHIVAITFHSLEDRIVKRHFRDNPNLIEITRKPITPTSSEISENPRSRSAKLRVAQKV